MIIAPSIVEIGLDLFEPLLIARTVERVVDLHLKRKTLVVERTSALSTLHSQRADHSATKTSPLRPKEQTTSTQRPYVSTSETYYKENAINPPQPAKRSIKVNFFSAFFFPSFISLSLLLKSTYHAPYHQSQFPFFFPTAFLTRFFLPTSFFTSSLASSITIRSRRSSAISSCSVGSSHEPLHFQQKSITDNDSSSIRHTVCDNFETLDKTSAYILN